MKKNEANPKKSRNAAEPEFEPLPPRAKNKLLLVISSVLLVGWLVTLAYIALS